jgi:hypothetical protein
MVEREVPQSALPPWTAPLGYGGLAPFVACALAALLWPGPDMRHLAGRVLVGYGAVILSFLGGVHWGLVLRGGADRARGLLAIAVLPSLAGWATLLMSFETAVAVQVGAFGGFWLYEQRVLGPAFLPGAYLALRRWLTLAAVASLGVALMAPSLVPGPVPVGGPVEVHAPGVPGTDER